MSRRPILLLASALALALVVAPPAPLSAAPAKKVSAEQMAKAKESFTRGQQLHQEGKYDEALEAYLAAHQAAPLPAFLFNIAQVYRLKGDKRKAVEYYSRYLAEDPGGAGAVEAQSHMAVLGREIAEEDAAAEEARQQEEAKARAAEERRRQEEARRAAAAEPPPGRDTGPRRSGRGLKIAGLATAGGGVLLTGVGVYFGLRARSLSNDLDALGEGDVWDPSLVDDGKAANRNFIVFTVAGGAALVTGGVLFYLGMRADRAAEKGVAVTPLLGPASAGLSLSGTFR